MRQSRLILAFLIAPLAASPGCSGGNTVWITGKLLKGGTQYALPEDQLVTITFVGLEVQNESGKTTKSGDPYLAEYDPASGTFTLPGPDRQGIPPGKYRVAVTQKIKREQLDSYKKPGKKGPRRETDMLADKFGIGNSPIVVEVSKSQDVTIDLDRPAGSAKQ